MFARITPSEFAPGMLTAQGRVLKVVDGKARVAGVDGTLDEIDVSDVMIDLSDRATFWLALDIVAARTGLDASAGLLWSLQDDPFGDDLAWVLESVEESRTRAHDTDDPVESLANALVDTAGSGTNT